MKRSTIAALLIGLVVSALVIVAQGKGLLAPVEQPLANAIAGSEFVGGLVSQNFHYAIVVLIAFGVAWLILSSTRRKRLAIPLALLALELAVIAWVCLLYHTFFQPLPSVLALGLSVAVANGYAAVANNVRRSSRGGENFRGRLSDAQIDRMKEGDAGVVREAKIYETTAVVCDIANKHDLAEECAPALLAEITGKFIAHATASFLKAGAYIETITGEGIVAVFGFPMPEENLAEKATCHALSLLESFEKLRGKSEDESFRKCGIHLGISSGTMIFAPLPDGSGGFLATGEPVELARRFCIANRFYGSRILVGPQTFELASKSVMARPIDFLSGVDVRERHEIYEPLMLLGEATPEQLARRDCFWNGVVLYREKRWAESYSQFQKARGPNEYDDAPLQLYLRRIEPLALNLVDTP